MKFRFAALIAVLALAFAGPALAQNGVFAPYVDAGISVSSSSSPTNTLSLPGDISLGGVTNPNYTVGAGIESNTKNWLFDVNGQFNSQNPTSTIVFGGASAINGTISGSGYYKLGFLRIGGGARYSMTVSSYSFKGLLPTSLDELVPFVGGGVQFSRDRFLVDYVLPGRSAVQNQREVDFHNEIFLTKGAHFRLTQDVAIDSGEPQVGSLISGIGLARVTGTQAGVGLKIVF